MSNLYYIYALKDSRFSPARPFYIGKGIGTRAWDHALRVDKTAKGRRIAEIHSEKRDVLVTVLADSLTESQALKLESELISAFGTIASGGILTNSVIPQGKVLVFDRISLFLRECEKRQKSGCSYSKIQFWS